MPMNTKKVWYSSQIDKASPDAVHQILMFGTLEEIHSLKKDIGESQIKEIFFTSPQIGKLIPFTGGFVLGGGTALSLQLTHRKSFDFDFFSQSPIPKNFLNKLTDTIQVENIAVDSADELTLFTLYLSFK